MDNYKPKDDTNEALGNVLASVIIKLDAHEKYIVPRISGKAEKLQAQISFETIRNYISYFNEAITPEELKTYSFMISDDKTHQKVLDTYEDIYYNMVKRFYGRSDDFYLEKI